MQRKKKVSPTVPVQSIIPRPLYAKFVHLCADYGFTIKEAIEVLINERVKDEEFASRQIETSDEKYDKAMKCYEIYHAIRDGDIEGQFTTQVETEDGKIEDVKVTLEELERDYEYIGTDGKPLYKKKNLHQKEK